MARDKDRQKRLIRLFEAAVDAADPQKHLAAYLPHPDTLKSGKLFVAGAGKASAAMAAAVEAFYAGTNTAVCGTVITPYGSTLPLSQIRLVGARHPVPDAAGYRASKQILETARGLGPEDTLICLISGGGSALMTHPLPGISLEDKQAVNTALLRCGASIDEMNCIRKHLSAIKGGRLAAAAYPARVLTFAVSDVPGDDPQIIASGPTVFNTATPRQALEQAVEIIERYSPHLSEPVRLVLARLVPARLVLERALKSDSVRTPDGALFAHTRTRVIATPQISLTAAAEAAQKMGYTPLILGDALEGEARELGRLMSGMTRQVLKHNQPAPPPVALISGGETTVRLTAKDGKPGKGGRNSEGLLSFALEMSAPGAVSSAQAARVAALFCDTDGKDGSENNAGAVWTQRQSRNASEKALDLRAYLENNDAFTFFEACDGLVTTGPTFTNVNDFRVILIDPA